MRIPVVVLALMVGWTDGGALCRAQCGFSIEPAADLAWHRAEGWATPGVREAKGFANVSFTIDGRPATPDWPEGITGTMAVFDKRNPDVTFPDAEFSLDGTKKRLHAGRFVLYQLVRWEKNGKVYAYSYELGPDSVLCTASVDLIDDKGDGKFRLMVPGGHLVHVFHGKISQPPPVPDWLNPPTT